MATRRKNNPQQRRRDLCDAAIELLGADGDRGLSHPKVDKHAGVPPGTTSVYFRTRKALLQGIAARMTELDIAELSKMLEITRDPASEFAGTAGMAKIVLLSMKEPQLTRVKARYELALQASRDAELRATLRESTDLMNELARSIVMHWHAAEGACPDSALVEEQTTAMLTYIDGVLMSCVVGLPPVYGEEHLNRLLQGLLTGIAQTHRA